MGHRRPSAARPFRERFGPAVRHLAATGGTAGLDLRTPRERWYISRALERCGGRIGETAELLGISRKGLWERMNRLGMARETAQRFGH